MYGAKIQIRNLLFLHYPSEGINADFDMCCDMDVIELTQTIGCAKVVLNGFVLFLHNQVGVRQKHCKRLWTLYLSKVKCLTVLLESNFSKSALFRCDRASTTIPIAKKEFLSMKTDNNLSGILVHYHLL